MHRFTSFALVLAACSSATPTPLESEPGAQARRPHPHAVTEETPGIVAIVPEPDAPAPVAPPEPPSLLSLPEIAPPSQRLARSAGELFNPFPGGLLGGYRGDTGLDIGARMIAVYAIADGTLDYSEAGHTRWTGRNDSPYTVRLAFDRPIPYHGRHITHVYYGHLSAVDVTQVEGALPRYHVRGGQRLGISGKARGVPHLHLGLLLDGDVSQSTWDNILTESQVREVLGGYKNGEKL